MEESEAQCRRSTAGRFDAQVTLAKLTALKAVDEDDGAELNQAIGILVEDHQNEAKHGENQRSTRGFVCLPALMFASLGAGPKIECRVMSPYLPLHLLTA